MSQRIAVCVPGLCSVLLQLCNPQLTASQEYALRTSRAEGGCADAALGAVCVFSAGDIQGEWGKVWGWRKGGGGAENCACVRRLLGSGDEGKVGRDC